MSGREPEPPLEPGCPRVQFLPPSGPRCQVCVQSGGSQMDTRVTFLRCPVSLSHRLSWRMSDVESLGRQGPSEPPEQVGASPSVSGAGNVGGVVSEAPDFVGFCTFPPTPGLCGACCAGCLWQWSEGRVTGRCTRGERATGTWVFGRKGKHRPTCAALDRAAIRDVRVAGAH